MEGHPVQVDLVIFDILGQRTFMKLFKEAFFRGAKGILAVADMRHRQTLDDLGAWIEGVENVAGKVPVVVIGANAEPRAHREVSENDVRGLAESYGAACFFASANSDEPVEQAFTLLAEQIASHRFRDHDSS